MDIKVGDCDISIIIPVLNEAKFIEKLLAYLNEHCNLEKFECIIVDGGSKDDTIRKIKSHNGPIKILRSDCASRSKQMNLGASKALGQILYFLHADVIPPDNFVSEILKSIQRGYNAGCFSYQFDRPSLLLKFNSWCTTFMHAAIGGGDQSLFIQQNAFRTLKGFDEDLVIM